ncbi:MAG: RidA family protein [Acidobacteriota bacterium]
MTGGETPIRQAVATSLAPAAIGPYSQAIIAGNLLFLSGQIPLDPSTGQLIEGDIEAQTRQVLRNLDAILSAAGASFASVVRTTVYMLDLAEFAAMNRVYETFVTAPAPARATVQVSRLPRDARVEIDLIAVV